MMASRPRRGGIGDLRVHPSGQRRRQQRIERLAVRASPGTVTSSPMPRLRVSPVSAARLVTFSNPLVRMRTLCVSGNLERDGVADKRIPGNQVVAAARVSMLRVAPVRILRGVLPEMDCRLVAVEVVLRDPVVLPVLDGNRLDVVARSALAVDPRVEAVATPDAVRAIVDPVADDHVAAERRLDAVGGREADVVVGRIRCRWRRPAPCPSSSAPPRGTRRRRRG